MGVLKAMSFSVVWVKSIFLLGKYLSCRARLPKGPGKSSSDKIINYDEPEVALGKQNERAACPKDKLEFKFFLRAL